MVVMLRTCFDNVGFMVWSWWSWWIMVWSWWGYEMIIKALHRCTLASMNRQEARTAALSLAGQAWQTQLEQELWLKKDEEDKQVN